jgi:hypothetical protein
VQLGRLAGARLYATQSESAAALDEISANRRDLGNEAAPRGGTFNFREAADNAAARVVERENDVARIQANHNSQPRD